MSQLSIKKTALKLFSYALIIHSFSPSFSSALAGESVTKITKVLYPIGRPGFEKALVYTEDKRIYQIPASERNLIDIARTAETQKRWVALENEMDELISITAASKPQNEKPWRTRPSTYYSWYQPTSFMRVEEVQKLMDGLTREDMDEDSQCYERAHYWTHSLWRDYSVRSEKVFLVFSYRYRSGEGQFHHSCKYIKDPWEKESCDRKKFTSSWTGKYSSSKRRDYFEDINIWHFHVAPLLSVRGLDYVLDPAFNFTRDPRYNPDADGRRPSPNHLNRPTTEPRVVMKVDDWTNMFVGSKRRCKWVDTYDEANRRARDSAEREHCFLVRVPMFYYGLNSLDNPYGEVRSVESWNSETVSSSCDARNGSGCGYWDGENKRATSRVPSHRDRNFDSFVEMY